MGTCSDVGFPVAEEKSDGPATVISVLGIVLDSVRQELRLPDKKTGKVEAASGSMEEAEVLLQA